MKKIDSLIIIFLFLIFQISYAKERALGIIAHHNGNISIQKHNKNIGLSGSLGFISVTDRMRILLLQKSSVTLILLNGDKLVFKGGSDFKVESDGIKPLNQSAKICINNKINLFKKIGENKKFKRTRKLKKAALELNKINNKNIDPLLKSLLRIDCYCNHKLYHQANIEFENYQALYKNENHVPLDYTPEKTRKALIEDMREIAVKVRPLPVILSRSSRYVRKIFKENRNSIVIIKGQNEIGAGVILNKKGYILTTNNTVKKDLLAAILIIKSDDSKKVLQGRVVKRDKKKNLVLIKLDNKPNFLKPVKFAIIKKLGKKEKFVIIGHPDSNWYHAEKVITIKLIRNYQDKKKILNLKKAFLITSTRDMSKGSPVFNKQAEFIGLSGTAMGSMGLINIVISVDDIIDFLPDKIKYN